MTKMKNITALLLTMVMFFTFTSISAFADDPYYTDQYYGPIYTGTEYDGIYSVDNFMPEDISNCIVTIKNGALKVEFVKDSSFHSIKSDEYRTFGGDIGSNGSWIEFYGKPVETAYVSRIVFIGEQEIEINIIGDDGNFFAIGGYLQTNVEPKEIKTSFTHEFTTDSGQYDIQIAGFIKATVVEGNNVLTSQDIAKQNISVFVENTITGETRTMNQSTIEGLTLNVSGGKVTSITLKGRVQTSKGTFERYTTTVNL